MSKRYPHLTDRQLIRENLREQCIYDYIGDLKEEWDDHKYFNYLFNMHFECLSRDFRLEDECAEKVMFDLGIEVEKIKNCMRTSFDVEDDWNSYNDLFEWDREAANDLGIQLSPTLTINS